MNFDDRILEYKLENGRSVEKVMKNTENLFRKKYSRGKSEAPKETFNGNLIPGKVYIFDYFTDSKLSNKIEYINHMPLGLYCGAGKKLKDGTKIEFFIDFIVTPHLYRAEILKKVFEYYQEVIDKNSNQITSNQIPLDLRPKTIKKLLGGTGYSVSYTGFKRKFFRNIEVIDYSDWEAIPYINLDSVIGLRISEIYKKYQMKLKADPRV